MGRAGSTGVHAARCVSEPAEPTSPPAITRLGEDDARWLLLQVTLLAPHGRMLMGAAHCGVEAQISRNRTLLVGQELDVGEDPSPCAVHTCPNPKPYAVDQPPSRPDRGPSRPDTPRQQRLQHRPLPISEISPTQIQRSLQPTIDLRYMPQPRVPQRLRPTRHAARQRRRSIRGHPGQPSRTTAWGIRHADKDAGLVSQTPARLSEMPLPWTAEAGSRKPHSVPALCVQDGSLDDRCGSTGDRRTYSLWTPMDANRTSRRRRGSRDDRSLLSEAEESTPQICGQ
jgi:hypothetical protein